MSRRTKSLLAFASRSLSRGFGWRGRSSQATNLRAEALESRDLLSVSGTVPSIVGTVFLDSNENGTFTPGEEVAGATVRLFEDDGDGVLELNGQDTQFGPDQTTDAQGKYCFMGISAAKSYFVVQPTQVVGGVSLVQRVSGLIAPGSPNLIIDGFQTNQAVTANPPAPSSDGTTLAFPDETEVIGAERDMFAELESGVGTVELLVNPFNLLPVAQFNTSSGVNGRAIITWDGDDADAGPTPTMGLGGRDLTQGGLNTGISMNLGIDAAGAGRTIEILLYEGSSGNFSKATAAIPVTDGTATGFLYVPFSDFTGPVQPNDVDAIQLVINATGEGTSADGQVDVIGVVGPKTFDIANDPGTDLSVTKTNSLTNVAPGGPISYTITVQNLGPLDVTGAKVSDIIPATIVNPTYTSVTTGTVTGNTASGSGNINDTINITVGSTVVYTVTGTVASSAQGSITNTATVDAPEGTPDKDLTNNTSDKTNTLTPTVDLSITKTNSLAQVTPGGSINYTITVSNLGPSDVTGATIQDTFPASLTNVTYTSAGSNGVVTGNTLNGSGNINDTVNMASGSVITYTVSGTVAANTTSAITNTATVAAPQGTTESNTANNSSSHTDEVTPTVDLVVTKTNNKTIVDPGETVTYTLTVQNNGPGNVTGAQFVDNFPSSLTNINYTSVASGGASGNTASGSGSISQLLTLPSGGLVVYTVTATVSPTATGTISNTASVTAPSTVIESNPANNAATDTDTVRPAADLTITKTNNTTTVKAGQPVTYTIVARNLGPATAANAVITDLMPGQLTNVTFTSTAAGGATGNTAAGSGNINDTVTMPSNSTITYTVVGTVSPEATGNLSNTASITAPPGTVDPTPNNNSATEIDAIDELLARISGFVYVDLNDDGVKDAGEPGIPDVTINLRQNGNTARTLLTDANGAYDFEDLQPGTYDIVEVQPTQFADGKDTVAGPIGSVTAKNQFTATVPRGAHASNLLFGELNLRPSKRDLLASRFRT